MSKRKSLISSILNDRRTDQNEPVGEVTSDDVRLLKEISLQVEREKVYGSFDTSRPGEHKPCPKDNARPVVKKKPAPKYNKALKEAERAALEKPLTPKMYRQLLKEHLEILPLVNKKMDKKATR